MEKYINEETIIKNDLYETVKDYIICPGCKHIIIEPIICSGCISNFCKKCIDNPAQNEKCPNGCENPKYQKVPENKNFIKKLKFKCIKGCTEEILFQDIKEHYKTECSKKKILRFLSKSEIAKLNNDDIGYITSKNRLLI